MTTYSFGEVSWDSAAASTQKKGNSNLKDLFLNLDDGENEVRVVTSPYAYLMHKYKAPGDKGFGRKVVCTGDQNCPLCKMGDKPKKKFYIGVIERKKGTYKILDMSPAVLSGMTKQIANKRWGDITKYDISITVDRNGGATGYYTVIPLGKEPLSAADQQIVDNVDLEQLKKLATPPTVEAVQKKIDYIHSQLGIAPGTAPQASEQVEEKPKSKSKAAKSVPVASEDEEFESFEDSD